jgi:hypothetical protein
MNIRDFTIQKLEEMWRFYHEKDVFSTSTWGLSHGHGYKFYWCFGV